MTRSELKYTTKESELFYFTGIKYFKITINFAMTKAVIILKNKFTG